MENFQDPNCIFCKVAAGQSTASVLFHDQQVTAFRDIRPVTPVHILVIPNRHIASLQETTQEDECLLGHMIWVARQLAEQESVSRSGYRLALNTGPDAGQSVFHIHLHLIGGRRMPFRFE